MLRTSAAYGNPFILFRVTHIFILWLLDSSLSGESVTAIVSGQRLGKHVPAVTNTNATMKLMLEMGRSYVVRTEML
jgi:hypothetical protein